MKLSYSNAKSTSAKQVHKNRENPFHWAVHQGVSGGTKSHGSYAHGSRVEKRLKQRALAKLEKKKTK